MTKPESHPPKGGVKAPATPKQKIKPAPRPKKGKPVSITFLDEDDGYID